MTTAVDDPWSSDPRPRVPHQEVLPEPERFDDDAAATNHYAGPFCSCGDYSCPANDNPAARCVNHEDSSTYTGRYPESWNDEAIAAYEARELADALISDARHTERGDTRLAVARLNALGAVLHPV